jgi:hypothetical protein
VAQGLPDRTSHTRFEGSLSVLVGRHGAMNPAGKVRCNMWKQIELGWGDCNFTNTEWFSSCVIASSYPTKV